MNDTTTKHDVDADFDLLDIELSEIEDLPGFEVPPNGEYILDLKVEKKKVNDKAAVEFSYEIIETVKLDKDTDAAPPAKQKFSQLFFLTGKGEDPEKDEEMLKVSLGKLKELCSGVAEATGQGNLGVLLRDTLAKAIVTATVKRRADKEDKERFYATVKNLMLA